MRQALAVFTLSLCGCLPTLEFRGHHRPPQRDAVVPVLACWPDAPFEELGTLTAIASSPMPILKQWVPLDEPGLLPRLQRLAGEKGCDAVVLRPPQACDAGVVGYELTCIAFLGDGP
jgi:hypothetical protein